MNINPLKYEPRRLYAFHTSGRELTGVHLQGPWPDAVTSFTTAHLCCCCCLSWLSITLAPLTDRSQHSQLCGVHSTPLLSTFYPTWVGGEWVGGGAGWTWPSSRSTSSHYEPPVNFSSLVSPARMEAAFSGFDSRWVTSCNRQHQLICVNTRVLWKKRLSAQFSIHLTQIC